VSQEERWGSYSYQAEGELRGSDSIAILCVSGKVGKTHCGKNSRNACFRATGLTLRERNKHMVGHSEAAAKAERARRRTTLAEVPSSGTWLVKSCSKKLKLLCPVCEKDNDIHIFHSLGPALQRKEKVCTGQRIHCHHVGG